MSSKKKGWRPEWMDKIISWVWVKAAIPKLWTLTICATYIILIPGWIPAIINSPGSLEGVVGMAVMYIIAAMITVGALTGVVSAFCGIFRVEKWSVVLVSIGILLYVGVVYYLHWTGEGNRIPQAQTILALLPTFIARFVHVTRRHSADQDELFIHKKPAD